MQQFYDSLNATLSDNIPDSAFLMGMSPREHHTSRPSYLNNALMTHLDSICLGTSLRELVKKFKYKVLVLLKLLLLEKRVSYSVLLSRYVQAGLPRY